MASFRKKSVTIDAITFDELVAHGLASTTNIVNGMPWSFEYKGQPITHENDACYLIPTLEGTMKMTPDDMLITGVKGEIYPCKKDIFAATYDKELAPHQERVVIEKKELGDKIVKLSAFRGTDTFAALPIEDQDLLSMQLSFMRSYSTVLERRIARFA